MELWVLYRKKYGIFNLGIRSEQSGAIVAATLANINKKPGSPAFKTSDFMINGQEPEESEEKDTNGYNELERKLLAWTK